MSLELDKKAIGRRIAERLAVVGLKKGEFADLIGRHETRISSYVDGEDLSLDLLALMAPHLKCSLQWLIVGEESQDVTKLRIVNAKIEAATMMMLSSVLLLQKEEKEELLLAVQRQAIPLVQLLKDAPARDLEGDSIRKEPNTNEAWEQLKRIATASTTDKAQPGGVPEDPEPGEKRVPPGEDDTQRKTPKNRNPRS